MAKNSLGSLLCGLDGHERRVLTPSALNAFEKLTRRWRLSQADAMALLGIHPARPDDYRRMMGDPHGAVLGSGMLKRISFLIGISEELDRLYPPYIADEWIHLPNRHPLFRGRPPLASLRRGLDAQKGLREQLRRQREAALSVTVDEP